jgi:hypothetical protein
VDSAVVSAYPTQHQVVLFFLGQCNAHNDLPLKWWLSCRLPCVLLGAPGCPLKDNDVHAAHRVPCMRLAHGSACMCVQ